MHIPNDGNYEVLGGDTGIVILGNAHDCAQLANSLHGAGLHVLARHSQQKNSYEFAKNEFLHLRERCTKIFLLSFFDNASQSLELAQHYADEVSGLILIEPKISTNRFSKSTRELKNNLHLIDQPTLILYPILENQGALARTGDDSLYIADEISSPFIREVVLENSFISSQNDLPVLVEESLTFINEINDAQSDGYNPDEDTELIEAEFQSIVAGLSLDQSTPNTFLDDLDFIDEDDHFEIPNPRLLPIRDKAKRNAIFFMIIGPLYALIASITDFNPFGIEPWPGILALVGGLAYFLYSIRDDLNDDDGAVV